MKYLFRLAAVLIVLMCSASAMAQKDRNATLMRMSELGIRVMVRAGVNVGGTAPIPIPSEMKSINSYSPGLNFGFEGDVLANFTEKWGVQVGARLENKSMRSDVTVENYYTTLVNDGDLIEGNYTGKERTTVSYSLLTFPVLATYKINSSWTIMFGPYFSYAMRREFYGHAADGYMRNLQKDPVTGEMVPTGDKVIIPADRPATYDFSDDMRRFQWGLEANVDWRCFRHFLVFAHLDWGLNDAFKSSFKTLSFPMYPIYAMVGFGYEF